MGYLLMTGAVWEPGKLSSGAEELLVACGLQSL